MKKKLEPIILDEEDQLMIEKADLVMKYWRKPGGSAPSLYRVFWNVPDAEQEGETTTLEITDLSYKVLLSQQKLSNEEETGFNEEAEGESLESDLPKSQAYSAKNDLPTPSLSKRLSFNLPNSSVKKSGADQRSSPQKQLKKR